MPEPSDDHLTRLRADLRIAITGAVIAAVLMIAIGVLTGNLRDLQAQALIGAAIPTLRSFASTVMIVTSSALALMLTILGLTADADRDIRPGHFKRISQIALAAVAVFIAACLLFVGLMAPPDEVRAVSSDWYDVIYYTMTALSALVGGAVVGIVLLIYTAVRDIATTFGPGSETPLLAEGETLDDDDSDDDDDRGDDDDRDGDRGPGGGRGQGTDVGRASGPRPVAAPYGSA